MECANPNCRRTAKDLFTGVLRLLEMEVSPGERILQAESGFPIFAAPTRFFWLCEACAARLKIRRWTAAGLVLETRPGSGSSAGKPPERATVQASIKNLSPGAA